MEKAAKAVRRSGVKLLSFGGGHTDLSLLISEQNDVKNTAKAFMSAQQSASQYLMKWAANEENRAIQDVASQILELNLVWADAQRELIESLKQFKQLFELIYEGEKHVDQAKNQLAQCDLREAKCKKELKRGAKRATTEEMRHLENRLIQAERQKDIAQIEVSDRLAENEAVKLIRLKEGFLRLSEAYVEMGHKCAILHEAQHGIAQQLPDVHDKEFSEVRYTGSGTAKCLVVAAKAKVKSYKKNSNRYSYHHSSLDPCEPPPPYTPGRYSSDDAGEPPPGFTPSPANITTRRQRTRSQQNQEPTVTENPPVDLSWDSEDFEERELSGAIGGMKF